MVMSWPSVQHKLTGPTSLQLGGTQTWELVLDMVREEVIDVRRGGLITRGDGQPAVLCHMTVGSEQQRLWRPLSAAVLSFTFLSCHFQRALEAADSPCYLDLSTYVLPFLQVHVSGCWLASLDALTRFSCLLPLSFPGGLSLIERPPPSFNFHSTPSQQGWGV